MPAAAAGYQEWLVAGCSIDLEQEGLAVPSRDIDPAQPDVRRGSSRRPGSSPSAPVRPGTGNVSSAWYLAW